jgi:hypothetical protein
MYGVREASMIFVPVPIPFASFVSYPCLIQNMTTAGGSAAPSARSPSGTAIIVRISKSQTTVMFCSLRGGLHVDL